MFGANLVIAVETCDEKRKVYGWDGGADAGNWVKAVNTESFP